MSGGYGQKEVIRILMNRDGMGREAAEDLLRDARYEVACGADPEEVVGEWFGLEPDYVEAVV